MSAIGKYVVLRREAYRECVRLVGNVHTESTGKWMFKKQVTCGLEEFNAAWKAAVVEEVAFDYSGYVIGNYLDAQAAVNGIPADAFERSPDALALNKVFTAAMPFEKAATFEKFDEQKLLAFCKDEYGEEDAQGMCEAIQAAHEFYTGGLARISKENVVVFVIQ